MVFLNKRIYTLAYLYLLIPNMCFLLGFIKCEISIPLTTFLVVAFVKIVKNSENLDLRIKTYKLLIVFLIIILWCVVSGVGGFIWQNRWDHKFRNAIFVDLVNYSWPVVNSNDGLCYYLGFWLPSALAGKVCGLQIGYVFQLLWAIVGVFISYLLISKYIGKFNIKNIMIFILFSGLDVVIYFLYHNMSLMDYAYLILQGLHLELGATFFNSSSNTTLLFWLYNQIIPFWVGMMLIILQGKRKNIGFIYANMLLFAPFPSVALLPVVIYIMIKDERSIKASNLKKIKECVNFENLVALLLAVMVFLFFKSNGAANKISILELDFKSIFKYLTYIFFEFGVWLLFVYKENYKDKILNILLICQLFLPFIVMGDSYDFAWRTCIPLSYYIMLLVMKKLGQPEGRRLKRYALIAVLCMGSITPISEIMRTAIHEYHVIEGTETARSESLSSIFDKENNECYINFTGDTESIFYKFIAKSN